MNFEILTYVPIDLDAILPEKMSTEEKEMLNHYHKQVYEKVSPYLSEEERIWLKEYTRAATINYFRNKISREIRQEIDNFINEKKYDLKEEVSVKSDYYLNTNHEYEVKCQILENGSHLIDMTLTVPTQTEAEAIVNNWNRKNQEIYALLLSQLL